ncbi:MAG: redox-regulated ATPase YchF [Puniceicoccales bacterium]|jgi:GTP-binding protein YchF|nr:redox-regulated ATPase YchF [Puniceicoccales bacterium]
MQVGIIGLPNVGKSTLFNALTRTRKAEACNYPFCTINPNVGIVGVPDVRLQFLQEMVNTSVVIPASIEFDDIAGLVAGASRGEGLGNKFLGTIREMDVLVHVVRCFEDSNIIHSSGPIGALSDVEIVQTELILADLESVSGQLERNRRKAKGSDKEAMQLCGLCERLIPHLDSGYPANLMMVDLSPAEMLLFRRLSLLTAKPVLYACNVGEVEMANAESNPHVCAMRNYIATGKPAALCVVSAQIEEELGQLPRDIAQQYLNSLNVSDSGVDSLIRKAYDLLDLATFFTAGEKEVRAWTFRRGMKAPQCAGIIHSDFEKGFIKAEVVSFDDLKTFGSIAEARAAGRYRMEGRDYSFQDGDVVYFRCNT